MSKIFFVCIAIAIVCNLPYSKSRPQYTWDVVDSRSDAKFRYFTHYQKREQNQIGTKRPRSTFVLYIMFNPSTGGVGNRNDPTIRKIMELTEQKFPTVNGFKILNLFAYMNPLPEKLLQTLHEEEQFLGINAGNRQATQESFNLAKGRGNEPATVLWTEAADEAENIIAAWGDLPAEPIPTGAALRARKFARYPDLVELINAHRADWTRKWIPMIKARKNEIANWLNRNYRGKRGYFLLSNKQNPRHPLKLQPRNAAHNFKNNPIPTPN